MKILSGLGKIKWYALITLLFAVGLYYVYETEDTTATVAFYVTDKVERGEVTSGIQTTGDIIVAQKLDIDIYKQLSRIDVVNIKNGIHVKAGDKLISFDKKDGHVDTQSAQVLVAEAELALEQESLNAIYPNTAIRNKENQIIGYEKTITDAQQDIKNAYRDFLNEDLVVEPHSDRKEKLVARVEPILFGRYVGEERGQYVIDVYSSKAKSGYSYRLSGLEFMTESIIFGKAMSLGNHGLKMIFPNDTEGGDKWVVHVPNTTIATYEETKQSYEQVVTGLEKTITDAKVNIANSKQELMDLKLTDSDSYRKLRVEKATTELAVARQRLNQSYDVVQERDIIAPFSGTVEGMENVVVGATPTGGSSDSINLGTLISDEFLTIFTLSATDVAKVEIGQKVKVTVTSFVEQPVFWARITQISSLPESSGVAQYAVQALLDYDRQTAKTILREGMLADIEVVEEEKTDALRVGVAAITYGQGIPKVTVVDRLNEQQTRQANRMGIVRTEGTPLNTYEVEVTLGIIGQYYVEVVNGLEAGQIIVTSASSEVADEADGESVVQQRGFGPGNRQNPRNR